jgi:hypothetical protein
MKIAAFVSSEKREFALLACGQTTSRRALFQRRHRLCWPPLLCVAKIHHERCATPALGDRAR